MNPPPDFPVAKQARTQAKLALKSSSNPTETITHFQQLHSLHSFLARAFGTTSIYSLDDSHKNGSNTSTNFNSSSSRVTRGDIELKHSREQKGVIVEPFEPESVLTFLNHLGVSTYEIHKKIGDALRDRLENEIQKIDLNVNQNKGREALLVLLKSSWEYIHVPELRPVFVTLIKKLGDQTPVEVLILLAKKDDNSLKYGELLDQFGVPMKRLVWEADWSNVVRGDGQLVSETKSNIEKSSTTAGTLHSNNVLSDIIRPIVQSYVMDSSLQKVADLAFPTVFSDRKMDTLKRRTVLSSTTNSTTVTTSVLAGTLSSLSSLTSPGSGKAKDEKNINGNPIKSPNEATSSDSNSPGLALAKLKEVMGSRPKLLAAVLNMLIAEHGSRCKIQQSSTTIESLKEKSNTTILGGSSYLHCTLVSDILLSYGQLPKQYEYVQILAKILDDSVKKGLISDQALAQIQGCLRSIFQPSSDKDNEIRSTMNIRLTKSDKATSSSINSTNKTKDSSLHDFEIKLLKQIVKLAVGRMKDNDSQRIFLNPVTDDIAPGYSKIIQEPMCMTMIENKASKRQYQSMSRFERDVLLMFSNCIRYNTGPAGKWFRDEAKRQQKLFKESIMKLCLQMYNDEMRIFRSENSDSQTSNQKAIEDAERIRAQQQSLSKKLAGGGNNKPGDKRKIQHISQRSDDGITGLIAEDVAPLLPSRNKRKKNDTDTPSMPALASMVLSDPLVVRLLVLKILNAMQMDILKSSDIPSNHKTVPSIMQLLYVVKISTHLCSKRGKVFAIPDVGFTPSTDTEPNESFVILRKYIPLVTKLLLEAEIDNRFSVGGDFHSHLSSTRSSTNPTEWTDSSSASNVLLPLVQGALIPLLRPNASREMCLLLQIPRFFIAINALSDGNMVNEKSFFVSLVEVLLKYKSKLPHSVRDLIVKQWLDWFQSKNMSSSMTGPVHFYFIKILNEVRLWICLL